MGRALKIGCGCALLALLLCGGTVLLLPRLVGLALPDPVQVARDNPLGIEGDCSREAAATYLADTGPRLERLFAGLEALSQAPSGQADLSRIDLDALRASRTALAATDVAPCLRAMRDEEVALADTVLEQVAPLQKGGTPSPLQAGAAILGLVRGVRVHVARIADARARLEARYGLTATPGPPPEPKP